MPELAAGDHTWSVSIADYAGNITSTNITFTATGVLNPDAPVIGDVSLADGALLPDRPDMWLQGTVGGEAITMNPITRLACGRPL